MKPITVVSYVNAPPAKVFAAMADFANSPARIKEIVRVEMLTPGPVGVGTKFNETRMMMKREETVAFEVTAFDPPNGYSLLCHSMGVDLVSEFRFVPEEARTKVELTMTGTAKTFFAKLVMPIMSLMAGTLRKCVESDLAQMKTQIEAGNG